MRGSESAEVVIASGILPFWVFLTQTPGPEHACAHTHARTQTQLLLIFFAAVRNMVLSLTTSWPACKIFLIPEDAAKFPLISVYLSTNICSHLTHWCIRFGQECWPKGGRHLGLPETISL